MLHGSLRGAGGRRDLVRLVKDGSKIRAPEASEGPLGRQLDELDLYSEEFEKDLAEMPAEVAAVLQKGRTRPAPLPCFGQMAPKM